MEHVHPCPLAVFYLDAEGSLSVSVTRTAGPAGPLVFSGVTHFGFMMLPRNSTGKWAHSPGIISQLCLYFPHTLLFPACSTDTNTKHTNALTRNKDWFWHDLLRRVWKHTSSSGSQLYLLSHGRGQIELLSFFSGCSEKSSLHVHIDCISQGVAAILLLCVSY